MKLWHALLRGQSDPKMDDRSMYLEAYKMPIYCSVEKHVEGFHNSKI